MNLSNQKTKTYLVLYARRRKADMRMIRPWHGLESSQRNRLLRLYRKLWLHKRGEKMARVVKNYS
jgi:hypothetical protein